MRHSFTNTVFFFILLAALVFTIFLQKPVPRSTSRLIARHERAISWEAPASPTVPLTVPPTNLNDRLLSLPAPDLLDADIHERSPKGGGGGGGPNGDGGGFGGVASAAGDVASNVGQSLGQSALDAASSAADNVAQNLANSVQSVTNGADRAKNAYKLVKQCNDNGCSLVKLFLDSGLADYLKAKFLQYLEIKLAGYIQKAFKPILEQFNPLSGALNFLNLPNPLDPSWVAHQLVHAGTSGPGNKYPATGATFTNMYNVEHGAIIAVNNYSPQAMNASRPKEEVVPLNRWSDIAFLEWKQACNSPEKTKALKTIMQTVVISAAVIAILSTALNGNISDLGVWPGQKYEMGTQVYEQLLGSPSGAGISWFVLQHKEDLGATRTILSIQVWNGANGTDATSEFAANGTIPSILYTLSDP